MSRNTMHYSSNQSDSSAFTVPAASRPTSAHLCDLHVYKVPPDLWRDSFNNILNNVVTETVSVGIIRVPMELRLFDVREELVQQLDDVIPRDYVFLRSVGRSLTRLRGKQEYQLKAKHFLPPVAYAPELYILEATPELRDAMSMSQSPPISRRTSPTHTHRGYPHTYRNGYTGDWDTKSVQPPSSPTQKYQPLPHIGSGSHDRHNDYTSDDNSNKQTDSYSKQTDPYTKTADIYRKANDPYTKPTDPYNKPVDNDGKLTDPYSKPTDLSNKPTDTYGRYSNNAYDDIANEAFGRPPPLQDYIDKPGSQPEARAVEGQPQASAHNAPDPLNSQSKHSPPRLEDRARDPRRHDNDSGVAGLTPEDEYNRKTRDDYDDMLRKSRDMQRRLDVEQLSQDEESDAERRRRLRELEAGADIDRQRWEADQEERRRQAELDRRKEEDDEEDRRKREEQERIFEEERRKKEEANRLQKEEDERRKREEEERRKEIEERDRLNGENFQNRLGSPPPRVSSRESDKDTESEQERRRNEKNQLLRELEEARSNRQDLEKEREDLVKKAKSMQHKTTNRRNEARDMWKKKYFEEKKKTAPLEESSTKLRDDLEALHKRLMNTLQGPANDKNIKVLDAKPSTKANYVILCTKLQHEIEDLRRRVETAKMKLTAEMKLRSQAQTEMKAVRSEAMQNRLMIKTARKQGGASSLAAK